MTLTVYGDESGTHDASPFMLLAGFVASETQWSSFDADWREALQRSGLSYFHATDLWGTKLGEQFGSEITRLTAEHLLFGYVIRLDKADYEKYYIGGLRPRKPQLDTMYGLCVRFLLAFIITRAPTLIGSSNVTFNVVLESGAHGSKDAERIRAALRKQLPTETAKLGSITFGDKRAFSGLQASDAVAFGAYQIEPTELQLSDIAEDASISQAWASSTAKPPIFRCAIDAGTLSSLKNDIITLVNIRKHYAESIAPKSNI